MTEVVRLSPEYLSAELDARVGGERVSSGEVAGAVWDIRLRDGGRGERVSVAVRSTDRLLWACRRLPVKVGGLRIDARGTESVGDVRFEVLGVFVADGEAASWVERIIAAVAAEESAE